MKHIEAEVKTYDDFINYVDNIRSTTNSLIITADDPPQTWNMFLRIIEPEGMAQRFSLKEMQDYISFGGSPRASINLAKASKAFAFIKRRGYVIPEDVRAMCYDVLRHRIGLTYEAEADNITTEDIITEILNTVEIP